MRAFLDRIQAINPLVNALVTITPEEAMKAAAAADEALARGVKPGLLHGLPVAHKDLQPTAGVRTTFGSPIFADHVPSQDSPLVARLRAAGAILAGKSNTPEFGAGSQTFNPVFGATLNPYDRTKTCGGSSGGAAVALACGMIPIADGTDMGGSLRNPAAFCGVVGMRPSPPPQEPAWQTLSVEGPMARGVGDVALLYAAIEGSSMSAEDVSEALKPDVQGARIAWLTALGPPGDVPFDSRVVDVMESARPLFASIGCVVDDATLDLSGADRVFRTLRAKAFVEKHAATVRGHRELVKQAVLEEIERGERQSAEDVTAAERRRHDIKREVAAFMKRYDFLVLPTTQVPPFDVTSPYVTEISGVTMTTYIDWMKSCYYFSAIGHPAISVPCGMTANGLPVGLQIVGRDSDDWGTLRIAAAFEQARGAFPPPSL